MWKDKDSPITPRCLEPEGCPIEDLATDPALTEYVQQFLTAKSLYRLTEDATTQRATFERLGLYEQPEFHLRLEAIYAEWVSIQQRQATQPQE
jgi:hypothetical protein